MVNNEKTRLKNVFSPRPRVQSLIFPFYSNSNFPSCLWLIKRLLSLSLYSSIYIFILLQLCSIIGGDIIEGNIIGEDISGGKKFIEFGILRTTSDKHSWSKIDFEEDEEDVEVIKPSLIIDYH